LFRAGLCADGADEPGGDPRQEQARPRADAEGNAAARPGRAGRGGGAMTVEWSWERARESLPVLWDGFEITLLATVIGFAIAAVIGLAIAIVRQSCPRWVAAPVHAVAEFIRLTPLVVQLLFAYNL